MHILTIYIMNKMSNLNWIGICIMSLGLIAFLLVKKEKFDFVPAALCLIGVVLFLIGFYTRKP